MNKLALILLVVVFSCKKKDDKPAEQEPEPAPVATKYYKFSSKNNINGRASKNTGQDTVIYTMNVNLKEVYRIKAVPSSTPGIWVESVFRVPTYTLTPSLTVKTGDVVRWNFNYQIITPGPFSDKAVFSVARAWFNESKSVTEPLGSDIIVLTSTKNDSIPFTSNGNKWTASKFWEFTAP